MEPPDNSQSSAPIFLTEIFPVTPSSLRLTFAFAFKNAIDANAGEFYAQLQLPKKNPNFTSISRGPKRSA